MAFVGIHRQIIEYGDLTCQYPIVRLRTLAGVGQRQPG